MKPKVTLNTTQVAGALGVSVSTIKRWIDEGVLPAGLTPGGHRKVLSSDVLKLIQEGRFPHADPSLLFPGFEQSANSITPVTALQQELFRCLLAGDSLQCRSIILGSHRSGMAMHSISDGLIGPAMTQIGLGWERGTVTIHEEHRATQICLAVLYELKSALEPAPDDSRPLAVGGAPGGDVTILPSLLAGMVLQSCGWNTINLGPNSPLLSIADAICEYKARLAWLSVSHIENESRFLKEYRELYAIAEKQQVFVAIGGRAISDSLRSKMPYTTYGDGLTQLASFARAILPRPAIPRRGRPPRKKS